MIDQNRVIFGYSEGDSMDIVMNEADEAIRSQNPPISKEHSIQETKELESEPLISTADIAMLIEGDDPLKLCSHHQSGVDSERCKINAILKNGKTAARVTEIQRRVKELHLQKHNRYPLAVFVTQHLNVVENVGENGRISHSYFFGLSPICLNCACGMFLTSNKTLTSFFDEDPHDNRGRHHNRPNRISNEHIFKFLERQRVLEPHFTLADRYYWEVLYSYLTIPCCLVPINVVLDINRVFSRLISFFLNPIPQE
jgi:hypothetical protein